VVARRYVYALVLLFYTSTGHILTSLSLFNSFQLAELKLTDFVLFMKDKGEYQGRKAIRIKGLCGDKTYKLSLKVNELRNVANTHFDDMVENPEDKFCIIRLH
jgi:hypothetical protein